METLEKIVSARGGVLEQLGELRTDARDVRTQFLQFLDEARVECSASRHEIKTGDEETRRYMRVLHEEVIDRLTRLQKG